MFADFRGRKRELLETQAALCARKNRVDSTWSNGWYARFVDPVLTADHVPVDWRYDLDPDRNPLLLERLGINAVFNAGAIELGDKVCLIARVEGFDRKSFFAVARSASGIDGFEFDPLPVELPQTPSPDVNVYDMRLTAHEDGYIYGTFCTERKAQNAPRGDTSAAVAACGIARTTDLIHWDRLADLSSLSAQQRNVVLHPEFVSGRYAFYTRPQDGFIEAGSGGGIGWALSDTIENASVGQEAIMEPRVYHTINEGKNGMGAPPLLTSEGWLHVAHGVRHTAAGLRYVLYAFLCDRSNPSRVTHRPGGYFLAPQGMERVGDVSNVAFCNGMVQRKDGTVLIYYASSDTRLHVAATTTERLLDYVKNTPPDPHLSHECVKQRIALIRRNRR